MSDIIISVEKLGKKYVIENQKEGSVNYKTLRGAMTQAVTSLADTLNPRVKKQTNSREEFWALKDVSFDIKLGDRVGIIGRNGAGKSTLLKILSRITEPTTGKIRIKGRVASLLEVGTGFHPELTGRENIFLNGAILGMSRSEIKRQFDEIVDFAEIEKFIDTPVKRYSSGMYVRLAFAVAAHLEPEILVVDEVLAVGDAAFQKKCLGKMEDVSTKEGRTVLFVSHSMNAVESLCSRCIVLESGSLFIDSRTHESIRAYLENTYKVMTETPLTDRKDRRGSGKVRTVSFRVLNAEGEQVNSLQSGRDYYFEIRYINYTGNPLNNVVFSFDFLDERGNVILLFRTNFTNSNLNLEPDTGCIRCKVDNLPLANGTYHFNIFISHADLDILDWIEDAASIKVDGGDYFGTGNPGLPSMCKILRKAQWSALGG
ncbi:ABC transporter ATP-binding protein [Aetokthonos hydrillicola Thurmond2011]|jgi:lipopolysaccharide transport system ATP-binding protein|uniref:ABC transporter ATP-binding protein n=1 Tax=Aetokthonos hydrillicola Thurmond2011 TaxID=2712845 RepID=A0AAP5IA41_9CYAN|nr:ABC transporter ATP-binding protein [Aetokthonos hydrillicola]MBO3461096.1 ABC transporter ATP-binding protein [Aetokthonos hydrillicola CCALA 1050]MBW4590683.1 ABC transporter ATP-binding protein [Aetokthonos hydrillicola CCALA 1050]MDR9897661.1 ABC transporter ATP-binding protein [Aetokthonos hydrillicola Thurmond2011]